MLCSLNPDLPSFNASKALFNNSCYTFLLCIKSNSLLSVQQMNYDITCSSNVRLQLKHDALHLRGSHWNQSGCDERVQSTQKQWPRRFRLLPQCFRALERRNLLSSKPKGGNQHSVRGERYIEVAHITTLTLEQFFIFLQATDNLTQSDYNERCEKAWADIDISCFWCSVLCSVVQCK